MPYFFWGKGEDSTMYKPSSDNGTLTKEQEDRVTDNIKLAYYMKQRWVRQLEGKYEENDIESCCLFGLLKSVRHFDPEKNVKFATFASKCINNEVLMMMRTAKRHSKNVSMSEALKINDVGNELLVESLISNGAFEDDVITRMVISNRIENINKPIEKEILRLISLDYNQNKIARVLGISQSYVSRLEKKLKKKIFANIND